MSSPVGYLAVAIKPTDTVLILRNVDYNQLPAVSDEHDFYFLRLEAGNESEVVRVVLAAGDGFHVIRGQGSRWPKAFPVGTNVYLHLTPPVWSKGSLLEQVKPNYYKLSFIIGTGTVRAAEEPVNEGQTEVLFQVIDVIEALGYQDDAYLTTALVYLMRLRRKDQSVVDVQKAIWWLQRWLAVQESSGG